MQAGGKARLYPSPEKFEENKPCPYLFIYLFVSFFLSSFPSFSLSFSLMERRLVNKNKVNNGSRAIIFVRSGKTLRENVEAFRSEKMNLRWRCKVGSRRFV